MRIDELNTTNTLPFDTDVNNIATSLRKLDIYRPLQWHMYNMFSDNKNIANVGIKKYKEANGACILRDMLKTTMDDIPCALCTISDDLKDIYKDHNCFEFKMDAKRSLLGIRKQMRSRSFDGTESYRFKKRRDEYRKSNRIRKKTKINNV